MRLSRIFLFVKSFSFANQACSISCSDGGKGNATASVLPDTVVSCMVTW